MILMKSFPPSGSWSRVHRLPRSHLLDERQHLLVNHLLPYADHARLGLHLWRARGDDHRTVRRVPQLHRQATRSLRPDSASIYLRLCIANDDLRKHLDDR